MTNSTGLLLPALSAIDLALLALGIAVGLVFGYFMFPTMRQAKRLRIELEQAKAKLAELEQNHERLRTAYEQLGTDQEGLEKRHEELGREHERYKTDVGAHFRRTADLVGEMTKSYAAVYDHLAGGARVFSGDADATLPFGETLVIAAAATVAAQTPASADETVDDTADEHRAASEIPSHGAEPDPSEAVIESNGAASDDSPTTQGETLAVPAATETDEACAASDRPA